MNSLTLFSLLGLVLTVSADGGNYTNGGDDWHDTCATVYNPLPLLLFNIGS